MQITEPPGELDELGRRLHGSLRDLARRYRTRQRDEVCCFGITLGQCELLELLAERGRPLSAGEVGEALGLRPSGTSRLVEGLVRRRLVRRRRDPRDGRIVRIEPTERGRRLYGTIAAASLDRSRRVLEGVAPPLRRRLVETLELLLAGLAAPGGDLGGPDICGCETTEREAPP